MSIENIIAELPSELRQCLDRDAERARHMAGGSHLQDWLEYEVSLQGIRAQAMRLTYSNHPSGSAYNAMVGKLMKHYGFDHLDKNSVTVVLWLTDKEPKYLDVDRNEYLTRKEILDGILKALKPGERSRLASPISARQRVAKAIKELAAKETKRDAEPDTNQKPLSKLKLTEQSLAKALQDKFHLEERLKRKDDGSLFDLQLDKAEDIAEQIVIHLTPSKAETIAKSVLARVKRKQTPAG